MFLKIPDTMDDGYDSGSEMSSPTQSVTGNSLVLDEQDQEIFKILTSARKTVEKSMKQDTRANRLLFGMFYFTF